MTEAGFEASGALGAPPKIAASDWVVMKFGGTSVSSGTCWETIAQLVRNRLADGLQPVVVHSALQGVSNALAALLESAASGRSTEGLGEIRQRHYDVARELELDGPGLLDDYLHELDQLIAGIRLVREVSVRVRVRIMALGELMSTCLGAAYLNSVGVPTEWMDAREILISASRANRGRSRSYLSAACEHGPDPDLQERMAGMGKVILTQGFIARNSQGETVLLGRGGSDTSAAYMAVKLQARRLEIWTDVPGMFTANPRVVPSARLLVALHYDEAQELASAGSTVLHPRCLLPLRSSSIPLFIRCTNHPELDGTVVSSVTEEVEPQVKGICMRNGLTLVSMDSVGMWHEVGFLARAFTVFSDNGVSVDLVSTSETNVTVSIDTPDGDPDEDILQGLVADLESLCRVRLITRCSAVSLVGRKIRTFLSRLAPALEVFEEERIHLMSQAANDLNLSFVIDEQQGPKLVRKLHSSIIRKTGGSPAFGPSWEQLFRAETVIAHSPDAWWMSKRAQLLDIATERLNAYVYDTDSVRSAARVMLGLDNVDRVLYAVKANFNADIIRLLDSEGCDFECVSPGEIEWLQEIIPDLDLDRILFTPNFAPREEYAWAFDKGLLVTLDNLYPLQAWPELFEGRRIFVRMDPGQGRGHHEHVKTAGVHSKFGVPLFEVDELQRLTQEVGADVVGIHAHSGSGVQEPEAWRSVAVQLVGIAQRFPKVTAIDLGGGLGVAEKPGDRPFDLQRLDALLAEVRASYPQYAIWLEPGRYLVARAGVLLTHVTQVKGKGDMRYIGVGTGMNSLIRPALYGSYHEIVNLSRAAETPSETATIVGPICETGDRLGTDRLLPPSSEGDVILIANAGAYGYVMSSQYNRREVAPEVVI
ncbi:MAG: bifunctional aspartate kinase/diaminopimelate decarboxylase [Gammaproteobacteria bacterium]|nr:bifunctional aspartate kinase/diaminopimelate decarboxylase [Gammaproteobacteria bacterium]MDH3863908.1 bifunctional aspartate kinase/diaminopimelate decarboxylase [Gammaproteobacteria bacterium]MDH4005398.1 bifunctional aspartate kinase/diaminopimelate decarboxylase [Gammaproteobacteria bacterium]